MDVTWVLVVATALIGVEAALIVWLLRHRAEVRAANNHRGGATFEFTLPAAPA